MKKRVLVLVLLALLLGCLCAQADSLTLRPRRLTLYIGSDGAGEGKPLAVTVSPQRPLRFISDRPGIADVDKATGFVTPVRAGRARIYCTTTRGRPVLKRVCWVTVRPQPPTHLSLDRPALTLVPGVSEKLTPQILPENAVNKRVTWRSSSPRVASVNKYGVVTGRMRGTAYITCRTRAGRLRATCQVTVDYSDSDVHYLIIGQKDYRPGIDVLESSESDARRFKAAMEALQFSPGRSKTGDLCFDLTGQEIRQALDQLSEKGMDANDLTYFYYSGHGKDSDRKCERGALVGVDGVTVPVDVVRFYLDQVPGTVVVVLDCCLAGQYIQAKGAGTPLTGERQQKLLSDMVDNFIGPSPALAAKGTVSLVSDNPQRNKYRIMVSCKPLQESWAAMSSPETGESAYSFFTYYLGEGLGVVGNGNTFSHLGTLPADRNRDGYVTLQEVHRYTAPKVMRAVRELDCPPQTVMVWPSRSSKTVFAKVG